MRKNNIFVGDYITQLEKEGITPKAEIVDVMTQIAGKTGDFYDTFRERLKTLVARYDTREPIKEGRRSIAYGSYLVTTACMPIEQIDSITERFPVTYIPLGDGRYRMHKDFPQEVREELELLHWCYTELETVQYRGVIRW